MITMYGIANCDTVKKAQKWLTANDIAFAFVSFREQPLTPEKVNHWLTTLGVEKLINKRSTSWRQLSEEQKQQTDASAWVDTIIAQPTLIKRPLLELEDATLINGFSESVWQQQLK